MTSSEADAWYAERAHAEDTVCLPVPDGYEWEELASGAGE